jgi:hypothetical protein
MIKNIGVLAVLLMLIACDEGDHRVRSFPKTVNLNEVKRTAFLPTLESRVEGDKNGIYAASLLMAWDELEGMVDDSIYDVESIDLKRMINATSHINVLEEKDYHSELLVEDGRVKARAFFRKSLPLVRPMDRDIDDFMFKEKEVENFGFTGDWNDVAHIVYYKSDDDFALSLPSSNSDDEIIIIKSDFGERLRFSTELEILEKNAQAFEEAWNEKVDWKYHFNEEDDFAAPVVQFSIEDEYEDIRDTHFKSGEVEYNVEQVYQRISFLLDEHGAEVETEAEITVEATEEPMLEEEEPSIKHFWLDNNFIVLMKRRESDNPYFALYVSNTNLMVSPGEEATH